MAKKNPNSESRPGISRPRQPCMCLRQLIVFRCWRLLKSCEIASSFLPRSLIYCHCHSSPTYKSTRTKAFLSIKLGKLSSQRLNRSRQMKVSTFHNVQSTDTVPLIYGHDVLRNLFSFVEEIVQRVVLYKLIF